MGGLSEEDIEKMVQDAEANAEADAKRRQAIEAKNEIDSLIYSTEKSLTDNAEKLDDVTKSEAEKAIAEAKEVKDGEDIDLIIEKKENLTQASHKIGQAIYGQQQGEGGGEEEEKKEDENTVDADFTEKSDTEDKDKETK